MSMSGQERDARAVEDTVTGAWAKAQVMQWREFLVAELGRAGFVPAVGWGGESLGLDEDEKRFIVSRGVVRDADTGTQLLVSAMLQVATGSQSFGWAMGQLTVERFDTYAQEVLLPELDRTPSLVRYCPLFCEPLKPGERQADRSAQLLARLQNLAESSEKTELARRVGFMVQAVEKAFVQ